MTVYDEHFEATRLAMLAEQHQNIVTTTGEVVFRADDDEDRLSGTSWTFVENTGPVHRVPWSMQKASGKRRDRAFWWWSDHH